MRTAVISDLHLGAGNDADLLRRDDALEPLLEALAGSDRLVLLGDVIELRDRPLVDALELARPVLARLAEAGGGALVVVPGNHDHRLVSGWLEQRASRGGRPLRIADRARSSVWPASELRQLLPGTRVEIHYPGMWIRRDVYATHGHYLDRHLTIPTFERLGLALVERTLGLGPGAGPDPLEAPEHEPGPDSCDDYERIVTPVYAFLFSLAQAGVTGPTPSGNPSKRIWDALSGGDSTAGKIRGWLLGSVALPGAVGVANRLGLGPVRADVSPGAITRAGVAAMAEVVERLHIDAAHVIFGHTHRRGPMEGEDEWTGPGKTRLYNTGSWVHSPSLLRSESRGSAYWPGTVAFVADEGPPELVHLLDHWSRADLAAAPESG